MIFAWSTERSCTRYDQLTHQCQGDRSEHLPYLRYSRGLKLFSFRIISTYNARISSLRACLRTKPANALYSALNSHSYNNIIYLTITAAQCAVDKALTWLQASSALPPRVFHTVHSTLPLPMSGGKLLPSRVC